MTQVELKWLKHLTSSKNLHHCVMCGTDATGKKCPNCGLRFI